MAEVQNPYPSAKGDIKPLIRARIAEDTHGTRILWDWSWMLAMIIGFDDLSLNVKRARAVRPGGSKLRGVSRNIAEN